MFVFLLDVAVGRDGYVLGQLGCWQRRAALPLSAALHWRECRGTAPLYSHHDKPPRAADLQPCPPNPLPPAQRRGQPRRASGWASGRGGTRAAREAPTRTPPRRCVGGQRFLGGCICRTLLCMGQRWRLAHALLCPLAECAALCMLRAGPTIHAHTAEPALCARAHAHTRPCTHARMQTHMHTSTPPPTPRPTSAPAGVARRAVGPAGGAPAALLLAQVLHRRRGRGGGGAPGRRQRRRGGRRPRQEGQGGRQAGCTSGGGRGWWGGSPT